MGRPRIGIWRKICRGDAGHIRTRQNLISSRYFLQMVLWLLAKVINHARLAGFRGSPTALDEECFGKIHEAVRLVAEASMCVEWITNSSELDADDFEASDKIEFKAATSSQKDRHQKPETRNQNGLK